MSIPLPVLAGPAEEILLAGATAIEDAAGGTLFRAGSELAGFITGSPHAPLEKTTDDLYRWVFAATRGLTLCRVWNYVPQINVSTDGLENYRRFCRGRATGFEEQFGADFQERLPAASAVGTTAGPLAVAFRATQSETRHFENPWQTPAFEYPPDYGPRPPSFSRATLVRGNSRRSLFLSGTAAIRGHATIAPDDLDGQLPCTLENLQQIAQTAGAGGAVGATDGWQRVFKVYLRCGRDLDRARSFLERHLFVSGDRVTFLEAAICRADLRVEIEAVLTK